MKCSRVLAIVAGIAIGMLMSTVVLAAEPISPNDPYIRIATARARAEIAVRDGAATFNNNTNSYGSTWQEIGNAQAKIDALYAEANATESKKGEKADKQFLQDCPAKAQASQVLYQALPQPPPFGRKAAADQKMGEAGGQFGQVSATLQNMRTLEDSWKNAKLDLTMLEAIYASIEKRASECRDQATVAINDVKALKVEWDNRLAETQKYVAGRVAAN